MAHEPQQVTSATGPAGLAVVSQQSVPVGLQGGVVGPVVVVVVVVVVGCAQAPSTHAREIGRAHV